ncbi:MAG: hypothetical protein ACJ8KU_04815 [Chthoniobacterales bacterium]
MNRTTFTIKKRNFIKAALALTCSAALLISPGSTRGDDSGSLVGVWRVTRHGMDCASGQLFNSFPALMTFHQDGTLHGDAVGPGSTAAEGTAEHGVWTRNGKDYSFRFISYGWDANGQLEGRAEITANLQLNGPNSFVYAASVCFFGADGTPFGCHCARAEGTRF